MFQFCFLVLMAIEHLIEVTDGSESFFVSSRFGERDKGGSPSEVRSPKNGEVE